MKPARWILISAALVLLLLAVYFIRGNRPLQDETLTAGPDQLELSENVMIIRSAAAEPIGKQYSDPSLFLSPIKQAPQTAVAGVVTGLIVPHHLLAKDLVAQAFAAAAPGRYRRIILMSPDHFDAGRTAISVTERNFSTVFGEVQTAAEISRQLKKLSFVSEGDFFYREHGLQAVLPFIKYYFPAAEIVALTFKPTVSQAELDQIIAILAKELPADSLVIQSTDFSHYLTPAQAAERDAQTIAALSAGDPARMLNLNQPDNIDSLAAQYVQARLQADLFGAPLKVLDHKNSQDYTTEVVTSSTSYLAAAYTQPGILPVKVSLREPGTAELILVGDIMLSRYIGEMMARRQDYDFPFALIKPYLAGADLVFGNLEGPISDQGVSGGKIYSFRADPAAARGLKEAGFTVLGVANNHIFDYGPAAFLDTLDNLKKVGLAYAGGGHDFSEAHQGATQEINGIKIIFLAYTDLLPESLAASEKRAGFAYLDLKQMAEDIRAAKEKSDLVIVSFHWGREYETKHNARQAAVAEAAIAAGASLIIGHHPHVVQEVAVKDGITVAYSLGNFIFDQNFSPETKAGLTLKVSIKEKKIISVEPQPVKFNHYFQPQIKD
ncbi:MAG: AmmeMemoRadiSam system protein B [Patescibacteria group bacterium]